MKPTPSTQPRIPRPTSVAGMQIISAAISIIARITKGITGFFLCR